MDDHERLTRTMRELRPRETMEHDALDLVLDIDIGESCKRTELAGPRVLIGAHASATLSLEHKAVSGLHCSLEVVDGRVTLRDLGSKNGTWINDVQVREVVLPPGGAFVVGGVTITLVNTAKRPVPASLAARFGRFHGRGEAMSKLLALLGRLASVDVDVLVRGETGTGKEVVARSLHEESPRAEGPFVVLDCTGLNPGIVESVLFGHKRGAFTGADEDRAGLLEQADGGTLFIDEVGELPPELQPKLLRALENRTTCRVGESKQRPFDAKIVAATHRDLMEMVNDGSFREDLYFRLGREVEIPSLRARGGSNISMLADLFLNDIRPERDDGPLLRFDRAAYTELKSWPWRGNVRELKSLVHHVAKYSENPVITAKALKEWRRPPSKAHTDAELTTLPLRKARLAFERKYVTELLRECGGNQSEAARRAGMSRAAFIDLLKRTGLK